MKKLLDKDSIAVGVAATLLSEILCALLIWLILLVAGWWGLSVYLYDENGDFILREEKSNENKFCFYFFYYIFY